MFSSLQSQAHLVGLAGSGMRALAEFLVARQWTVSGSDVVIPHKLRARLESLGVCYSVGHDAAQIPEEAEIVIVSAAIPESNPELIEAARRKLPVLRYNEFLGEISKQIPAVAVAGTHGKTTTSLLLKHLLSTDSQEAGCIAGGKLRSEFVPGIKTTFSPVIIEACEFRQHFLKLRPQSGTILNIEPDHFDCFPDLESLKTAFTEFARLIPADGFLVINSSQQLPMEVSSACQCPRILMESGHDADRLPKSQGEQDFYYRFEIQQTSAVGTEFVLIDPQGAEASFLVPLWGEQLVGNAAVACLIARHLGRSWEELQYRIQSFPGVSRRFELVEHESGALFVDDYAHHPTEIRATIRALQLRFPDRPLRVVFQPHQMLRTEKLLSEFAAALLPAAEVIILPIFAARESADERIESLSRQLVERGRELGGRFEYVGSLDLLTGKLDDSFFGPDRSKFITATLGAGDIDRIYYELPGFIC